MGRSARLRSSRSSISTCPSLMPHLSHVHTCCSATPTCCSHFLITFIHTYTHTHKHTRTYYIIYTYIIISSYSFASNVFPNLLNPSLSLLVCLFDVSVLILAPVNTNFMLHQSFCLGCLLSRGRNAFVLVVHLLGILRIL